VLIVKRYLPVVALLRRLMERESAIAEHRGDVEEHEEAGDVSSPASMCGRLP